MKVGASGDGMNNRQLRNARSKRTREREEEDSLFGSIKRQGRIVRAQILLPTIPGHLLKGLESGKFSAFQFR